MSIPFRGMFHKPICTHIHAYIYLDMYIYICVCVCECVCISLTGMCACVHTYIYIYTHTSLCICTHKPCIFLRWFVQLYMLVRVPECLSVCVRFFFGYVCVYMCMYPLTYVRRQADRYR